MQIEKYGHEKAGRAEQEALETEKTQAGIEATRAGAEADRATALLRRTQAGAVAREAEQKEPQWPNLSGSDLPTARMAVKNARINPAYADRVQKIEQLTDAAAVSRIIQERVGQEKPGEGPGGMPTITKWGVNSKQDQEDAMIEWTSSALRNKTLEAAIAKDMGYNLSTAQGYYDDILGFIEGGGSPLLPEEKVKPLKPGVSQSVLLGRILATTTEDGRQRGLSMDSINSFIENTLPDLPITEQGYRQLGPHVQTTLEKAVVMDADGQIISSTTRKPVKTYNELVRHLLTFWDQRVTNMLMTPNATALKSDTEQIGKAIIARYAPIIASRLGIPVPQPVLDKLKRAGEPTVVKLLRGATEFLGGQVPGILQNIGFGEEEL